MINIVKGDLLLCEEDIIGHQVNCKGVMGSGLASSIKSKYPDAFTAYAEECLKYENSEYGDKSKWLLGKCQFVSCGDKTIANLFGQNGYGRDKQYTQVDKLERSLTLLKNFAKYNNLTVALPFKIGSDRGGADWKVVLDKIETVFSDYEVTLYNNN